MREGDGGGLEMTKVEARGGPPVSRQGATMALVADERCIVGKR